jgi:hypothetical protein
MPSVLTTNRYSKNDDLQAHRKRRKSKPAARAQRPRRAAPTNGTTEDDDDDDVNSMSVSGGGTSRVSRVFNCTVCQGIITRDTARVRPGLNVLVCSACADRADKASDGCLWCGSSNELVGCGSDFQKHGDCEARFCKACIDERNELEPGFDEILEMDEWRCFSCNPEPIKHLRKEADDFAASARSVAPPPRQRRRIDSPTAPTEPGASQTDPAEVGDVAKASVSESR